MFRLIRLTLFALPLLLLFLTNPGIENFASEAKKIVEEEQSAIRAGWSAVSSTVGIDALTGAAGIGMFEVCRANYYVFSAFRVKPAKMLSSDESVGLGIGAAGKVIMRRAKNEEGESNWVSYLASYASDKHFTECQEVKKPGNMAVE